MNKKTITAKLKSISIYGWIAIAMVVIASFLRLYNMRDSLQFQGDQGRDVIIVSQIFKEFDPVFIGPVTSVGNMYLGPLYYYFMLPFLLMTYPDPMGPSYAVAVIGIITVGLMYFLGKKMIGPRAAVIATTLYTFSATVIWNTRFSWNPNPAPLVSLLMIFFSYKAWKDNFKYWILVSLCFSILIQLHYLTLLSAAGAGLIFIASSFNLLNQRKKGDTTIVKTMLITIFLAFLVFALSLTPLMLFDYKHNGQNVNAFKNMFTKEENFKQSTNIGIGEKIVTTLKETEGRAMHILFEYNIGKETRDLNKFLVIATLGIFAFVLAKPFIDKKRNVIQKKDTSDYAKANWVIAIYLATGILGTSLYQHTIFDHYIAYLFPVTFLTFGIVLDWIMKRKVGMILSFGLMGLFIWSNIQRMPFTTLGWTLDNIKETSDTIYDHVLPGEKYDVVLLSESNDHLAQNYRYFLTTKETPPLKWEESTDADTLIIINEEKALDDVTTSPMYAIASFPNKEPVEIFQTPNNGPEITVLRKKKVE